MLDLGKVFLTFWHHHSLLRGYWFGFLWVTPSARKRSTQVLLVCEAL